MYGKQTFHIAIIPGFHQMSSALSLEMGSFRPWAGCLAQTVLAPLTLFGASWPDGRGLFCVLGICENPRAASARRGDVLENPMLTAQGSSAKR